ncbi:MAG: tetratricopeptide repeat protein [Acetobacteraceae bacterium]|nr:tetratricopeptide repeat protein [Acetobacteraceae bacterium]
MNGRVLVFGFLAILVLAVGFDVWWQLDVSEPARTAPAVPGSVPVATPTAPSTVPGAPLAAAGSALPAHSASNSAGLPMPPRIGQGAEYERCLRMVPGDPAGANALAYAWEATGGGDGATHCQAAAQLALGNTETGARILENLAKASKAAALTRAFVFGQATQAWLMAGDAARAYGTATMALALAPDDIDLLIDRSIAAATMARYLDAIDDLNLVLSRDQWRTDALVFRAAAWRHEGQIGLANDDVNRALAVDPGFPEAMLERGILHQRRGDLDGARADWQRAIELAPDTAIADLAQQNLFLLEAGPRLR